MPGPTPLVRDTVVPTPDAERSLTPDLARGAMLLLIALAHTRMIHTGGHLFTKPAGGGVLDAIVQGLETLLVDGRAYPMFALLFGYGLVQITRRSRDRGLDPIGTRRLLRRRGAWLVVFGLVHVLLLYSGDILAAYGVLALLLSGAVSWSGPRLWTVAGACVLAGAAFFAGLQFFAATVGDPQPLSPDLLYNALIRLAGSAPLLPVSAIGAAGPVLIGIWAGRNRVLGQPERYRPLLRRTALIGLPVAVFGAVPVTLQALDLWTPGSTAAAFAAAALHNVAGVPGGLAYAAIVALVARRIGDRRGPVTTALAACGQRSMTCYLAQSVVWFVATEPLLLDLHLRLGVAAAAAVAVGTWALTVLAADALRRAGRRGPAEALLRRLVYRT